MIDIRDQALQSVVPTVMVPKFSDLEPLSRPGHRFLMAQDGVWIEALTPWCHVRRRLVTQGTVPMPYGAVEELFDLTCGPLPMGMLQDFVRWARKAHPNETAAWLIWNHETKQWRLSELAMESVGPAHVRFDRPALRPEESLVVDLHSHGDWPAIFSTEDDADDRGELKISVVVGHCGRAECDLAMRLCLHGHFEALPIQIQQGGSS